MPRLFPALSLLAACGDVSNPTDGLNDQEVVTTVELSFAPEAGESLVFAWSDPESDGDPVVDPIALAADATYAVAVRFLNGLEDPPEDLTAEVEAEADEHQVFFTGSALEEGLLTHAYADEDASGLPVGLASTVTTGAAGSGELVVTLRHLPAQDGVAVKTGDLAATAASEGLAALPGESDASVGFPVSVQ